MKILKEPTQFVYLFNEVKYKCYEKCGTEVELDASDMFELELSVGITPSSIYGSYTCPYCKLINKVSFPLPI